VEAELKRQLMIDIQSVSLGKTSAKVIEAVRRPREG